MYSITIRLQTTQKHTEMLADDLQAAEMLVETVVSQALLELFEIVMIEDVTIRLSSLHDYSIPSQGNKGVPPTVQNPNTGV